MVGNGLAGKGYSKIVGRAQSKPKNLLGKAVVTP